MVKRRKNKNLFRPKSGRTGKSTQGVAYLLEQGTLAELRLAKERTSALLRFHWDYYSELARQRNAIWDEIQKGLIQASISDFKFRNYQRAVKWKYGLHPLSTAGSLSDIGGRFNTGSKVNSEVPHFPALYLAVDKDTALQETLGQIPPTTQAMTAKEIALTNPQSEVIVSVSGQLEKVFDLRNLESLESFFRLIRNFSVSPALLAAAKFLNIEPPGLIRSRQQLLGSLLLDAWRVAPTNYDIPANPQIFGHLIDQAGIEGIIYPSKLTGKDCLVIFPHNFEASSSYLSLDHEPPHPKVPSRIDKNNWRVCDLSPRDLI